MKFKKNGGFTLVELIVVIAILAILAGVAVPAYSGYIQKANKAADLQLLGAVNTAFGAACMEQQISNEDVKTASITINSDGTVGDISGVTLKTATLMNSGAVTLSGGTSVATVNLTALNEAFDRYFAGNTGSKFQVIKLLVFSEGAFVEASEALSSLAGSFSADDIAALKDSAFNQIGMDSLLNKVDLAAGFAASGSHEKVDALVDSEANLQALAEAFGYETWEDEAFDAEFGAIVDQKAAQLAASLGGTAEDHWDDAYMQVLANNTILTAATNPNFKSDEFVTMLVNGTAKDTINSNLSSDPATALSQAAMAYAMYTSYNAYKGNTVSDEPDLQEVLKTIATDDFKAYMQNNSSDDVAGYNAAMNMVGTSASNKDAVSNLLVNGFTNADLLALLNQATNQG